MVRNKRGILRYALYARCSTDEQTEGDFTTLDAQSDICRRHALSLGGEIVKTYSDGGKTGTSLSRPGWKAMLADAKSGAFDAVCITYMSRLGRGDAATIAEYLLKEAGVSVACVHEQYADDEAGFVNKSVNRLVDGMYVMQVRKHTITKMREMFDRGYVCGHVPFGYRKETVMSGGDIHGKDGKIKEPPKRAVPDENDADVVRQAFTLYLETGRAVEVRQFLRTVTGRAWTTTETTRLLADERYTGTALFGKWRKEDAHPALIDWDLWSAAQARVRAKAARYAVRHEDNFTYYLRGRVFCPHCGCPFTQAAHKGQSKRIHYYVCREANRRMGQGTACPVVRLNAENLHRRTLEFLQYASSHRTVMHGLIAASGGWGDADDTMKAFRGQLGKQKQALEMRISRYINFIGDGRESQALLEALDKAELERAALIQEIEAADARLRSATVQRPTAVRVQESWKRVVDVWEVLDEEERAQMLGAVVERIEATNKESVQVDFLPFPGEPHTAHSQWFALSGQLGAARGVIAINPPLLTTPTFPPVELDYDIIRPKRILRQRVANIFYGEMA